MIIIYEHNDAERTCIGISEPSSLEQWVRAMKAEGLIKRNARFASFRFGGTEALRWVARVDGTQCWYFWAQK